MLIARKDPPRQTRVAARWLCFPRGEPSGCLRSLGRGALDLLSCALRAFSSPAMPRGGGGGNYGPYAQTFRAAGPGYLQRRGRGLTAAGGESRLGGRRECLVPCRLRLPEGRLLRSRTPASRNWGKEAQSGGWSAFSSRHGSRLGPRRIVSPGCQLEPVELSELGSAGAPSAVPSLKRNPAIRSSSPPGAGRRRA
jgi:hypothetical protein